jgi:hypothetical protein
MKGVPRIGHPDIYGAPGPDPEDLHVVVKKPEATGPPRPARARQVVRRTPKDLARARAMLTDALEGLQEGRYTTYKAEALARGARALIRLAERRLRAREEDRKRKVQHVVTIADWAGGGLVPMGPPNPAS